LRGKEYGGGGGLVARVWGGACRRPRALGQWEGAAARAVRDALLARVPASLNRRAIVDAMRFPLP
jgi:hypothetical protein